MADLAVEQDKKQKEKKEAAPRTPAEFAKPAKAHYEHYQPPEKGKERADHLFRDTSKGFLEQFHEGSRGDKIKSLLLAGAAIGLGAFLLKKTFDTMSSLKETVQHGLEETAGKTFKNILGLTLGAGAAGMLYEIFKGKLNLNDVLGVWNREGKLGVAKLLAEKTKDGTLKIGKDTWAKLSTFLGLPSYETVAAKAEEVLEQSKELYLKVENALGLKKFREEFVTFVEQKCPAAADKAKEWAEALAPAKIVEWAKAEGTPENEILTNWIPKILSMGGSYFLLTRLFGGKTTGAVGVPGIIYFFLVDAGKDSILGKGMITLAEALNSGKNLLAAAFDRTLGIKPGELGAKALFEHIDLKKCTEDIFDSMKEHPYLATGTISVAWWMKGYLWQIFKAIFKTGISATVGIARFIKDNPLLSAYLLAIGEYARIHRKELVDNSLDALYGKDPKTMKEDDRTQKEEFRKMLYDFVSVTKDHKLSGLEKQESDIIAAFSIDPLHAGADVLSDVYRLISEGKAALGWDMGLNLILLGRDANPLVAVGKVTVKETLHVWETLKGKNDDSIVLPIGGMAVLGAASYGGFQAYRQIIVEGMDAPLHTVGKLFKSFVPFTQEWRMVFKSCSEMLLWPIIKPLHMGGMAQVSNILDDIESALKSGDAEKAKTLIEKRISQFKKKFHVQAAEKVWKESSKTRLASELNSKLHGVLKQLEDMEVQAGRLGKQSSPEAIQDLLKGVEAAKEKLQVTNSLLERFAKRMMLLFSFHPIEAWKREMKKEMVDEPDELLQESQEKTPSEKFEESIAGKKPEDLKKELQDLQKKSGKSAADLERMQMLEVYLDPLKKLKIMDHESLKLLQGEAAAIALEESLRTLNTAEKSVQALVLERIEKAAGNEQAIKELDEMAIEFAQQKAKKLEEIAELYKKTPKELRSATLKAMYKETCGSKLTKIVKASTGRMGLVVLMASAKFAERVVANREKKNEAEAFLDMLMDTLISRDMAQVLIDVMPFLGTFSNFYSAATGEELVGNAKVSSAWDRLGNTLWGVASLAGDVVTVLAALPSAGASAPVAVFARLGAMALKGGKAAGLAKKLLKNRELLMKGIEKFGGIYDFGKAIKARLTAERVEKGIKVATKVERAAAIGGLAMTGINIGGMIYGMVKTDVKIPEDIQEVVHHVDPEIGPLTPASSDHQ